MEIISSLAEQCQRLLSPQGRLSTAIPGFVHREAQSDLAVAIAKVIEEKDTLVAEAGTGTGKTFAYLLPVLLSGKRALISTATKTLQDQLFQKDLPMLVRALGLSARIQNLKGRANYLCRYRIELYSEEGHFQTPQAAHELALIRQRLGQLTVGERAELPEIKEDSSVWPFATSTTDNCLGSDCPSYQDCFLIKARKRAMEADVVVINHHLFFADSKLREEGFAELFPGVEAIIFDEAHQLLDIAVNFFGERIGTRQLQELVDDMLREWPILDLANQPLKDIRYRLDKIIDQLLKSSFGFEERLSWPQIRKNQEFMSAWDALLALKEELKACFSEEVFAEEPGLKRCQERLLDHEIVLNHFLEIDKAKIQWLERYKQALVWHSTPFEVAEHFRNLIQRQQAAFVFTSATLTIASSFACFTKPLGLEEANTLELASPFDYQHQALLYLPRSLPDPKDSQYYELLLKRVIPVINACGGRCFFLFTSHKALNLVAARLAAQLKFPLLIQGEEAKPILLARFRELGNAVLLGTATFWEGVDVKGEALSCVIIDKLPFASPVDPVVQGKMAYYQSRGLSGFDEITLPEAVIALKQGVGRLIRDVTDKGVLVLADPRLTARNYGALILASLPAMPKTRDENKVLTFIQQLALKDETVST